MAEQAPYLARLKRHPHDREIVLVEIPTDLNAAIGNFEPARLAPELHGYVMHHNAVPAFYRWARSAHVHVVDERTSGHGKHVLPVECSACGQPGRLNNPPTRCPSCGEKWLPVTPPGYANAQHQTTTPCPSCQQPQTGRFPYCATCGAQMAHERPPIAANHRRFVDPPRKPLDEPLPLSVVVPEGAPARP